jgi:hypothetical protein
VDIIIVKQIQSFLYLEGGNRMEVAGKKIYAETLEQQQIEVRQSVIDGLRQAREGKTKDFNTVCDRLEKKYINAKV